MIPTVTLNDGTAIPQLGFGTGGVPQEDAAAVVSRALDAGYRHIDTAQRYGNEAGVGEAIARSGVPREELYVASKLADGHHARDDVLRSFDQSLAQLRFERLDLFLIHWPLPTRHGGDFVSTWTALLELVADGRLTSAGVSNFEPEHLSRIIGETGVAPVVNQIEVHPFFPNEEARAASRAHGIAVEAWAPLAKGRAVRNDVVREIAAEAGREPSQVVLRWHLQRGDIVFPKSMSGDRIVENLQVFDFELAGGQMARIDGISMGEAGRGGPHPVTYAGL
ncbi:aldo/keto reductase [Demequina sp. NBRC 110056]|uniref:aldo/keto reductase n=1 Tax=Demequina sp. NBRC 110056 TaxID=1570345 RepID=UPI000A067369|nr:aldo/keto reductase [Demequina sp. NBRC 110056]